MRQFLLALVLSLVLILTLAFTAAAAYVPVTIGGQTFNLCDHLRPGSSDWFHYHCDVP